MSRWVGYADALRPQGLCSVFGVRGGAAASLTFAAPSACAPNGGMTAAAVGSEGNCSWKLSPGLG